MKKVNISLNALIADLSYLNQLQSYVNSKNSELRYIVKIKEGYLKKFRVGGYNLMLRKQSILLVISIQTRLLIFHVS